MNISRSVSVGTAEKRIFLSTSLLAFSIAIQACETSQVTPPPLMTPTIPTGEKIDPYKQRALDTIGQGNAKYLGDVVTTFPKNEEGSITTPGMLFDVKTDDARSDIKIGIFVPEDPTQQAIPIIQNVLSEDPSSLAQWNITNENGEQETRYGVAGMRMDGQYMDALIHGTAKGSYGNYLEKGEDGKPVPPLFSIIFSDVTPDNVGQFIKDLAKKGSEEEMTKYLMEHIYGFTFWNQERGVQTAVIVNQNNKSDLLKFVENLFRSDFSVSAAGLSPVEETAQAQTPTPDAKTITPSPEPTAIAPISFPIEQLNNMTSEQKLAASPQVESAPVEVVSSSLPEGSSVIGINWSSEKTLTFWDRVVTYKGNTADGKEITLYYDLESGQWANKYSSFEEVSKIPSDKIPNIMIVTDQKGDHLIRNKNKFAEDWISQPQSIIDNKMVFRDERGNPIVVFNTLTNRWMDPKESNVLWTKDKWIEISKKHSWVGDDGKERDGSVFFKDFAGYANFLNSSDEIKKMPNGTHFVIYNPSGEITFWTNQEEAAERFENGALVQAWHQGTDGTLVTNLSKIAYIQWQAGNKNIFIKFGNVGYNRSEITGMFNTGLGFKISDIPTIKDSLNHTVSPVLWPPEKLTAVSDGKETLITINNDIFWLDNLIKNLGATFIFIPADK